MNPHESTRRGARARFALVSVAALCLAAQAATLAEHLFVRHAWCAAHGDWVHADELAPESNQRAVGEARDPALVAADGDSSAHDHCALLMHRRQAAIAAAPASGLQKPCALGAPLAAFTPGIRPIELLRLAPKSSPPAA